MLISFMISYKLNSNCDGRKASKGKIKKVKKKIKKKYRHGETASIKKRGAEQEENISSGRVETEADDSEPSRGARGC